MIARRKIARVLVINVYDKQMAALEFGERVPMPIKKLREDFRFYFALFQLVVALLVARVVFSIGINRRHEHDVFSIGRPDSAVRAGRCIG